MARLRRVVGLLIFAAHRPIDLITALATQRPDFARMLQQGRYHIIAGPLSRPRTLAGPQLYQPLCPRTLHLTPPLQGPQKDVARWCWV